MTLLNKALATIGLFTLLSPMSQAADLEQAQQVNVAQFQHVAHTSIKTQLANVHVQDFKLPQRRVSFSLSTKFTPIYQDLLAQQSKLTAELETLESVRLLAE